ncbi:hypothetical protein FACS189481_2590 [Clostridia bacterium]|nr:hypothetical protein FACS189481_2590 [Clostridia bacterium]
MKNRKKLALFLCGAVLVSSTVCAPIAVASDFTNKVDTIWADFKQTLEVAEGRVLNAAEVATWARKLNDIAKEIFAESQKGGTWGGKKPTSLEEAKSHPFGAWVLTLIDRCFDLQRTGSRPPKELDRALSNLGSTLVLCVTAPTASGENKQNRCASAAPSSSTESASQDDVALARTELNRAVNKAIKFLSEFDNVTPLNKKVRSYSELENAMTLRSQQKLEGQKLADGVGHWHDVFKDKFSTFCKAAAPSATKELLVWRTWADGLWRACCAVKLPTCAGTIETLPKQLERILSLPAFVASCIGDVVSRYKHTDSTNPPLAATWESVLGPILGEIAGTTAEAEYARNSLTGSWSLQLRCLDEALAAFGGAVSNLHRAVTTARKIDANVLEESTKKLSEAYTHLRSVEVAAGRLPKPSTKTESLFLGMRAAQYSIEVNDVCAMCRKLLDDLTQADILPATRKILEERLASKDMSAALVYSLGREKDPNVASRLHSTRVTVCAKFLDKTSQALLDAGQEVSQALADLQELLLARLTANASAVLEAIRNWNARAQSVLANPAAVMMEPSERRRWCTQFSAWNERFQRGTGELIDNFATEPTLGWQNFRDILKDFVKSLKEQEPRIVAAIMGTAV